MDLLKDVTRELRGGETATGDQETTEDSGQSGPTSATRSDSGRRSASERVDSASNQPGDGRDPTTTHVCPFCETEFDVNRGVCPECDAEIVLRGER